MPAAVILPKILTKPAAKAQQILFAARLKHFAVPESSADEKEAVGARIARPRKVC